MDINNQKDLDALLALCRKRGVAEMSVGNITFKLSPIAPQSPYKRRKAVTQEVLAEDSADPFQAALKQAKANAKRSHEGLTASLEQNKVTPTDPGMQPKDYPNDMEMLLWSAGGSGDV